MNDLNLKDAMMQSGLMRSPDLPEALGMTPQKDFSSSAVGRQTQPLKATAELALARKMGLSPERYQAVTGRPYPVAEQKAQPGQSAATPGAAPTFPAARAAQRGVNPEKLPLARDNLTVADLLKQELARQPNIGLDEPISALDRAKLRIGTRVGGVSRSKRND